MLCQLAVATVAAASIASRQDEAAPLQVRADSTRHEVVISAGPIRLPAATPYDGHMASLPVPFDWPVAGWARGYRIDLVDARGSVLPREMLHHAGIANLERRQVAYPLIERLFAAGRETIPVMLPASMGVPLAPGTRMLLYYALVNPTDEDVDVTVRVTIAWTPERTRAPREVIPLILDVEPPTALNSTFDVPPGHSEKLSEFVLPVGGRVRQMGGHLHDFATEIRLEEVATGRILVRLAAERNADGTVRGVHRASFILHPGGLRLDADRLYRIVAVYDNPTCTTSAGAMAFLAGPFAPDDVRRLPSVDVTNAVTLQDLDGLAAGGHSASGEGHAGHHMAPTVGSPRC